MMAKHVAIEGRHPRPSFIVDDDSSPPHTNINDFNPGHTSSPSYYDHHVFHHHLDLLYSQTKMRDNSANRSHVTEATHDVTECSDTEDCFAGLEVSAVNTHSSILNITEDHEDGEGEFDENEFNFLFPDDEPTDSYLNASLLIEDFTGDDRYHLDPESVYPKHKETDCTNEQTTYYEVTASFLEHNTPEPLFCTTPADSSLLDQIDFFFERLCFSKHEEMTTVSCYDAHRYDCLKTLDVYSALGCYQAPTDYELDFYLSLQNLLASLVYQSVEQPVQSVSHVPRRNSAKRRRARVNQLLSERGRTTAQPILRTVRSVDGGTRKVTRPSSHLDHWMGLGKVIPMVLTDNNDSCDGYDSDSCIPYSRPSAPRSITPKSVVIQDCRWNGEWQNNMYQLVQESMNCTWDLTWLCQDQPVQVTVWMERGTLIKNNSLMVEPRLIWQHSMRSPRHSVRLIHVCRVRAFTAADRAQHTLARASTCFVVVTTAANNNESNELKPKTYVFQAATVAERDAVMLQWKMAIARFATLAVLEDAASLLREFFITNSTDDK